MTSWQKAIKYAGIAFAVFLIVSIIGGILVSVSTFSVFLESENIADEMQSYEIESLTIKNIDVDISASDFVIKASDKFLVKSNIKNLKVDENSEKLSISDKKRFNFFSSGNTRLELYIPKNIMLDIANLNTGAGRVTVEALSAQNLDINLGAGEVNIDKIIAEQNAKINGGAGKITINYGYFHNLDLDVGVGALDFTGRVEGRSDIDCGVGQSEINLIGSKEDYKIDINKGIGDIVVDGNNMGDGSVFGSGINTIDLDGGIGQIYINFK